MEGGETTIGGESGSDRGEGKQQMTCTVDVMMSVYVWFLLIIGLSHHLGSLELF